jgi:glycosyltransferase involved in cell wall biosynthesis
MRSNKILILTHESNYGSASFCLRHLGRSFEQRGFDVNMMLLTGKHDLVGLLEEVNRKPFLILAYNGIAFDVTYYERYLLDVQDSAVIAYLVDHPFHQVDRVAPAMNNATYTCVDHSHVKFLNQFLKKGNRAHFMPHFCLDIGLEQAAERDIDILFPGSLPDARRFHDYINALPQRQSQLLMQMIDHGLSLNCRSLHEIAIDVLQSQDLFRSPGFFTGLIPHMPAVDLFIRSRRRELVLKELERIGLAVDIFGQVGNRMILNRHRVHVPVPAAQLPNLMSRAKVVLQTGPLFVNGSHVRVFTAMSSGAAVVADRTTFWEKNFEEDEEILTYTFPRVTELGPAVQNLLENPEMRDQVADAGRYKVRKNYSANIVASRIIQLANEFHQR